MALPDSPQGKLKIHGQELAWVSRGYARLAETLQRNRHDVRIEVEEGQQPGVHGGVDVYVRENGEWECLGKLLSPYGIAEVLAIMRQAEEQIGS